ncbi:MAG: N5-glutamine methyltransferase family protein [Microthrixaceae bacterium]
MTRRLVAAGCVAAEEEARELLAARPDGRVPEAWLRRREQGEPLPWITGSIEFCGHRVRVRSGVYVPRFQSEELARRAADLLPRHGCAVDLCTGAGAIAAHLQRTAPTATVLAVDVDPRAAACARDNGVVALAGDVDRALWAPRRADVVTAVCPYVPTGELALLPADVQRHEPRRALDGGADGTALLRRVIAAAAELLRPGGWLLVELGGTQDEVLSATLDAHGFVDTTTWRDAEGELRGLAARSGAGRVARASGA